MRLSFALSPVGLMKILAKAKQTLRPEKDTNDWQFDLHLSGCHQVAQEEDTHALLQHCDEREGDILCSLK